MTSETQDAKTVEPMYAAQEVRADRKAGARCGHEHGNVWNASECAVQHMKVAAPNQHKRDEPPEWGVIQLCNDGPETGRTLDVWFLNEYRTREERGAPGQRERTYTSGRFVYCHGVFTDYNEGQAKLSSTETTARLSRLTQGRSSAERTSGQNAPAMRLERHSETDFPIERTEER